MFEEIKVTTYNILDTDLESNYIPRTMDLENVYELKKYIIENINNSQINTYINANINIIINNLYDLIDYIYTQYFFKVKFRNDFKSNNNEYKLDDKLYLDHSHINNIYEAISNNNNYNYNYNHNTTNVIKPIIIKEFNFDYLFNYDNICIIFKIIFNQDIIIKYNNINDINNINIKLQALKQDIIKNNNYRNWEENRGIKIFDELRSINSDIICLQEYGSSHFKKINNNDNNDNTLCKMLNNLGYKSLFFLNKGLKWHNDKPLYEGVSIYYKKDKLRLFGDENQNNNEIHKINNEETNGENDKYNRLICGDDINDINDINNIDDIKFHDDRNFFIYKDKKFYFGTSNCLSYNADEEYANTNLERTYNSYRTIGIAKLQTNNNINILVLNTHAQSDSTDRENVIKITALNSVLNKINSDYYNCNIIFAGDFNIDLYKKIKEDRINILKYENAEIILNNSSYKIKLKLKLKLVDNANENIYTSYNNDRCEYIDYIFSNFENQSLKTDFITKENSNINIGNNTYNCLPYLLKNTELKIHPSDHIPFTISYQINNNQTGGLNYKQKYLKYKIKYLNLSKNILHI